MTTTDRVIMVRESEWREMREALEALLVCPAIFYGNLNHPVWGCKESAEAETKARTALAKSEATHPAPDGCGREGKQIEAAARAIADAWGETWECCCTEQRGLDCDCGYAMTDERDGCDERLTREDCRMAARAALSALTAGGDDG